jgi:hypothetical protein
MLWPSAGNANTKPISNASFTSTIGVPALERVVRVLTDPFFPFPNANPPPRYQKSPRRLNRIFLFRAKEHQTTQIRATNTLRRPTRRIIAQRFLSQRRFGILPNQQLLGRMPRLRREPWIATPAAGIHQATAAAGCSSPQDLRPAALIYLRPCCGLIDD